MKNKKNLLVTLAAFAVTVCASVGVLVNGAGAEGAPGEASLVGGEINAEYLLGESLSIPAAQLVCDGEKADAKVIITKPNGELVQTSNIPLSEGGVYTVEYRAVFGGKVKTVEKTFTVQTPLFSVGSKNSFASYGEDKSQYKTGIKGVNVDLADGDTLVYNDIIDLNASEGHFLEFMMMPNDGAGTNDLRKLTITLTDLHDPSIKLTVIAQCPADNGDSNKWEYENVYMQSGGQNQTPTGLEGDKVHAGNDWGAPTRFSFYGMHGTSVAVGTETLKLVYNKEVNAVYANGVKIVGLDDLNYFKEEWTGFTTGEVTMTIKGEKYATHVAHMLITKIGVNNLNQVILEDVEAPEIAIDFAGYDGEKLPYAAKGYSYPVFEATAEDVRAGSVPVTTTVYYNYESSQRYQVPVTNGRFETTRTGYYTIEYLAMDAYQNLAKKTVKIECKATAPALSVSASGEYATVGETGTLIFPADVAYDGGTGSVKTYATAKLQGGEEIAMDEGFMPEYAGEYTVTLYAVDVIGNVATATYTLTVSANAEPVFLDEVVLPKFLLSGYNYTLPSLSAYDFSEGKEKIQTTIRVQDGGEERELVGGVGNFIADENGYATIIYQAVGKAGNSQKSYKVPVIDTWVTEKTIDMSKYFYGENITAVAEKGRVRITSTQDTEYTFVNPMIADKFEMQFSITENGFSALQIVLTDSVDESVKFTIDIEKSGDPAQNALLKINGVATRYIPSAGFYDGNVFYFSYDEVNKILKDDLTLKQIVKNADGTIFGGFPSGKLYATAKIIGVNSVAEVAWKNIGGQNLGNTTKDTIKPSIAITNDYASSYAFGDVCEIYSAITADVLSPETTDRLTVYDPNGNVVKDINGLRLEDVPFTKSYFISLQSYGSYSVIYASKDKAGREQEYYYAIYVTDSVAPIISLQGVAQTEVKLGGKINVVKAVVTDNLDTELPLYVYMVDPASIITKVENGGSFVATRKGVYEIRYMTIDSFGNLKYFTYKVTVV